MPELFIYSVGTNQSDAVHLIYTRVLPLSFSLCFKKIFHYWNINCSILKTTWREQPTPVSALKVEQVLCLAAAWRSQTMELRNLLKTILVVIAFMTASASSHALLLQPGDANFDGNDGAVYDKQP